MSDRYFKLCNYTLVSKDFLLTHLPESVPPMSYTSCLCKSVIFVVASVLRLLALNTVRAVVSRARCLRKGMSRPDLQTTPSFLMKHN